MEEPVAEVMLTVIGKLAGEYVLAGGLNVGGAIVSVGMAMYCPPLTARGALDTLHAPLPSSLG